eukprot:scaffold184186_cov45-Prasinocladus_malaysianus.AAC.1
MHQLADAVVCLLYLGLRCGPLGLQGPHPLPQGRHLRLALEELTDTTPQAVSSEGIGLGPLFQCMCRGSRGESRRAISNEQRTPIPSIDNPTGGRKKAFL